MTDTTATDAPRKSAAERQRDAALKTIIEQGNRRRLVLDTLNLQPGERARDVIHLDDTTAIVQVTASVFGAVYAVVFANQRPRAYQATLDQALLYAVQLRNGGRPQDDDYRYAGRVLRVPEDDE